MVRVGEDGEERQELDLVTNQSKLLVRCSPPFSRAGMTTLVAGSRSTTQIVAKIP